VFFIQTPTRERFFASVNDTSNAKRKKKEFAEPRAYESAAAMLTLYFPPLPKRPRTEDGASSSTSAPVEPVEPAESPAAEPAAPPTAPPSESADAFFIYPSDVGGVDGAKSLMQRINLTSNPMVKGKVAENGAVYKHRSFDLNYVHFVLHGVVINLIVPMLAMLARGFCLRKWKLEGANINWFLWIVCDIVAKTPVIDAVLHKAFEDNPSDHLLLATRDPHAGINSYGHEKYTLSFVNMKSVFLTMTKAPEGWVDIFNVPASKAAPVCKTQGCTTLVTKRMGRYWHSYCDPCCHSIDNERKAAARLTPEGLAGVFASTARERDLKDGASPILSTDEFKEHILPLVEAGNARFGKDVVLSKERLNAMWKPTRNSYTDNVRMAMLVTVPYRFNMGGMSSGEHAANGETSKGWSFASFLLFSCAQTIVLMDEAERKAYDIASLFDPLSARDYASAKSCSMGHMTLSGKRRKDGGVAPTVFDDLYTEYKSIDQISGFFPLTYELNNKGGTARIGPYGDGESEGIEEMAKRAALACFGDGVATRRSLAVGSPFHQLVKFSPERLDNDDTVYHFDNVVPIACAFQTSSESRTKDPVLEAKKKAQKWQRSVFLGTDFCDMAKVYRFIPDEAASDEKFDTAKTTILAGLKEMVANAAA